jgi:CDP-2,3-bis-(O-geranylgeranyl)-sn-glycerol synthase
MGTMDARCMGEFPSIGWILLDLLRTIVIFLPAMTANTFAPFTGGGTPVDFGLSRPDGRRYLGDGKTWRGFIGGVLGAAGVGLAILLAMDLLGMRSMENSLWGPAPHNLILIFTLPFGSLVGDMIGSYIKRALNRPRGTKTPLLDQWDYLIGTAIFVLPFYPWWYDTLIADHHWISLILFPIVAYMAHVIANRIGYWIGVKKEPW